jgi:hypothetical protein
MRIVTSVVPAPVPASPDGPRLAGSRRCRCDRHGLLPAVVAVVRFAVRLGLVAALVVGCQATDQPLASGAIGLLTARPDIVGCPANVVEGDLVADPAAGTAISTTDSRRPIKWPYGYSGGMNGTVVEISDPAGQVVARTGTKVRLDGGEAEKGTWVACPNPLKLP